MLAPPDHPAGRPQPSNSTTATSNIALTPQNSQQIDTSSSFQPTTSLHPNQQSSQSFTTHVHSPALEYLLLPVDSSDDDPSSKEDQQPSQNVGRITAPSAANYTPSSVQSSPLPFPATTTPTQSLQHQQQQQNEYSIPESMGHESIGDFVYIGTFPENDATNSNYEMQQRSCPDSFHQMQEVQHLNRAFSPQPSVPHQQQQYQQQQNHHHQQQQQYQQQQNYQQQPHQQQQQQRQASYPPPPIMHSRAHSEPVVHLYPEPNLVDTRVNENNTAVVLSASAGRSLSYKSYTSSSLPSPPTKPKLRLHRKNRICWIGGAVAITLIIALIALVVVMKEGHNSNDNKNNDSDTHSSGTHHPDIQQPPIYTALQPPSAFPARPTPTRGPPSPVDGPQVLPPPLPSFPAKNKPCSPSLCIDYLEAYIKACSQDGAYRTCAALCLNENGVDVTCDVGCRDTNQCFIQGTDNQWACQARCGFT